MKVSELIALLQKYPQDSIAYVGKGMGPVAVISAIGGYVTMAPARTES